MFLSFGAAATFFCTYELTKVLLGSRVPQEYASFVYMLAATAGEVVGMCVLIYWRMEGHKYNLPLPPPPFPTLSPPDLWESINFNQW